MTPEMLHDLAERVAAVTGIETLDAERALQSGDASLVDLAQRLVTMNENSAARAVDLTERRLRIAAAA